MRRKQYFIKLFYLHQQHDIYWFYSNATFNKHNKNSRKNLHVECLVINLCYAETMIKFSYYLDHHQPIFVHEYFRHFLLLPL